MSKKVDSMDCSMYPAVVSLNYHNRDANRNRLHAFYTVACCHFCCQAYRQLHTVCSNFKNNSFRPTSASKNPSLNIAVST